MLLGNKSDCEGSFDKSQVEEFCKEKNLVFRKGSAKTGDGVATAFNELSEKLTKIHPKIEKKETTQNAVVSNIMKKKNEFQLRSAADVKPMKKKKCC